jgi:zinc D-Ala-D-Ala carboxypeptidase
MQLSKHFTLREMTNSMTAQRKGIDNTPGSGEIKSLGDLCYEVLEPLRAHFDRPVTITSGYRSEALCEAIGSKKTSQHAKGQAVDLEIFGVPNIKTAYWLQNNVDFDQLIMEYYDPERSSRGMGPHKLSRIRFKQKTSSYFRREKIYRRPSRYGMERRQSHRLVL